MALTKISTDGFKDDAVTTDKLANAINTERTGKIANVVEDTSPQLGGDLASNGSDIVFAGTDKAKFGTDKLAIYHDGNHSLIEETGTGNLFLKTTGSEIAFLGDGGSDYMVRGIQNGAVELYHNANKKLETASDKILFYGHAKVNSDNAYDLGAGGARWKDLYLSGGLFVGGTGSANELDDYEEGTWTPTLIYQNTSGLTLATNSASGKYTKIGNVCYVLGYINWDVSGSPINDNVGFGGLPFVTNTGQITAGSTRLIWNVTLANTNAQNVTHQLQPYGTSAVSLSLESEQGNRSNELGSGSGFQARWQGWYFTE